MGCEHEDADGYTCDEHASMHGDEITDHEFKGHPDILATLSYFEHGNCRWGLSGTMTGMPDFNWDGVQVAGLLIWNPSAGQDELDRKWWSTMGVEVDESIKDHTERLAAYVHEIERRQREQMAAFLEEYTQWCNGETYWIQVEEWIEHEPDPCPTCDQNRNEVSGWEEVEHPVGGYIGWEWAKEGIDEFLPEGVTADDIEIIEKY